MTIKDVAKKAGVSVTTISRVINNKEGISSEKRRYIQNIIGEMGYRPNAVARGLVTKRTSSIGLLIPDITNPFFPQMARGVEDESQKNNYSVFLCNTDGDPKKEIQNLSILKEKGVDGIILSISEGASRKHVREILDNDIPIVLIDEPVKDENAYGVYFNNFQGGYTATKHLIDLGHKSIACITGSYSSVSSTERMEGYKQALIDANIEINEDVIKSGEYKKETGFHYMNKIFELKQNVTAVFCASDVMVIGVYRSAKEHKLKIPEDLSIVGLDDSFHTQFIGTELTDVRQPTHQMGKKATQMLIKLIQGKRINKKIIIFEPELVIRESTREINT